MAERATHDVTDPTVGAPEDASVWPALGWCWDLPVLAGLPCSDRRYGPQTPAVLALLSWVSRLTPDQVRDLAAEHRRVWQYDGGGPPHIPARLALRAALDRAGRAPFPGPGGAYLAVRSAVLTAWADEALWPVLDAAGATVAVDLVDTVPGWHADAYVNLMTPWLRVVDADLTMLRPAGVSDDGVVGPSGVVWRWDELAALKVAGRAAGKASTRETADRIARILAAGRADGIVPWTEE